MAKVINFFLGAVAGAVLAGVISTLLAPSSGIELQGQLKDYVQNVQDEVKKARDTRRQELELQLETLRKP
jgi:gas vesicle protein